MKKNEKNYISASMFYMIGNIIGQGVVLLSTGIFTQIMDKNANGLFNTYAAWVLVFNTFVGLNLFITVRNAYIDFREDYSRFCSSILLFSLGAFVAFSFLLLGTLKIVNRNVDLFIVMVALVQAISVHTINLRMAVLSMEGKYKRRTALMILPNITHVIVSIVLILLFSEHQYYAKAMGNAIGILIYAIIIIVIMFRQAKPMVIVKYWKYAAIIAVPSIACTLADLILLESDRIMLTNIISPDITAEYSLVYNVGSILIALYTAINGAWTPWFYERLKNNECDKIKKVEKKYIYVFLYLAIGVMTVSPEIVKVLSPKSYWGAIKYVSLIVIAAYLMFLFSFFTTYLMYKKKTVRIGINAVFVAMLNIVLNFLLINRYEAVGAAIATIVSYLVLYVLHGFVACGQDRSVFCLSAMFIGIGTLSVYACLFVWLQNLIIIRYMIVLAMFMVPILLFIKYRKNKVSI